LGVGAVDENRLTGAQHAALSQVGSGSEPSTAGHASADTQMRKLAHDSVVVDHSPSVDDGAAADFRASAHYGARHDQGAGTNPRVGAD
jgi:hypothetical protein